MGGKSQGTSADGTLRLHGWRVDRGDFHLLRVLP